MSTYAKVVLVTGGSSGLGLAICSRLAAMGHVVYGTSRKPDRDPSGWRLIAMDITDEASVRRGVEEVLLREHRIDVVVNNAGLGIQGAAEDTEVVLAQRLFDANLFGAHRVCRAVLPGMRDRKGGLIINISSIAANFGLPYRAFYSASKAALDRYSEALRIEVMPFGVKVVSVQPGGFKTNIASSRLKPDLISTHYQKGYTRAMEVLSSSLLNASDPDELAQLVAKIIASPNPGTIYRAAQGVEKLSVLLKKLLPGRWFEGMVGKHLG